MVTKLAMAYVASDANGHISHYINQTYIGLWTTLEQSSLTY